jgi:hypothetical protein
MSPRRPLKCADIFTGILANPQPEAGGAMKEPNPYHKELREIRSVQKSDSEAAVKLIVKLRAKIEDDVEQERHKAHAALAHVLVQAEPENMFELAKDFVEKWIDIPARLYLFRFEDFDDPKPYLDVLDYLKKREDPIWEVLAPLVGGADALRILIAGRGSYWTAEGMELAKTVADSKSSPQSLIESFMQRLEIPSFDDRGGFTERFTAIGRDTLFAVMYGTRWVSQKTYQKLADFIGCKPEQLYPRIPRPKRKK